LQYVAWADLRFFQLEQGWTMKRLLPLFLLGVLAANPGMATISVKQYMDSKRAGGPDWQTVTFYVSGLGHGMMVANTMLAVNHKQQLFCSPAMLALDAQNYLDIIDKRLDGLGPHVADSIDIAIVLEAGIVDTFPCKPERN
jgi:hypothetical protein